MKSLSSKVFQSISVIIPVRNREELLEHCLVYLFEAARHVVQEDVSVEIVVANDASTDGTGDVVNRLGADAPVVVRQVELAERQGPARARNAALAEATGELVIFVDSDVIVSQDFFVDHLQAYTEAGAKAYVLGGLINVDSLETALRQPESTAWDYSGATLDTANASVPMEHLQAIGFFDSGFEGMGWQDLDLGRRLRQRGLERVAIRGGVAYHIVPPIKTQAQLEARLQKERERGVSAVRYMEKHPGLSARMAAQDTRLHNFLSWAFRMGGLVREDNVLRWVGWARRRRLVVLEKMWLAGVINKAHLESLAATKRSRASSR